MIVRDRHRERVGQAFARAQALHRGQGGIQHIAVVAVGVHAERAVAARRIAQGRETDHIMHIRIRGHGQRAVGNGVAFGDVHGCGGQHRQIIGAVDSHGQGIAARAPVIVGHRESEGVGQALAHAQALHRGQAVIQGIGIVAVRIHAERAVTARRIGLRNETDHIMHVHVRRCGQRAADRRRVLGNGGCGRCHCGRVIAAVDGHGQGIAARAPVIVGHRESEGVGQALAHAQALHRGQAVIQGIGILTVGVHAERAVTARRIGLRGEADHIVHVHVRGCGQRAADAGRILGNDGRGC